MHNFYDNLFLAAKREKNIFEILIPLIIFAVYAILAALKKKSDTRQGGGPIKTPTRPSPQQQHGAPSPQFSAQGKKAVQQQYDKALEFARHQYNENLRRIQEYARRKPPDVSAAVWRDQIANARRTVDNEFQNIQEQLRQDYFRATGRVPQVAQPAVRKPTKHRRPPQPVPASTAPQFPPPEPQEPKPQASQLAEARPWHLPLGSNDLANGVIYSEILGKPLALREDE
jgi:hypothetical protein